MDKEKNKKKKTTKITKKDNKKRFNLSLGIIVLIVVAASILAAGISAYAATTLINSREVKYDNTTSGINATNVQDAIVELNNNATDYSSLNQRLTAVEDYKNKIYPVGSIYISINNTNPSSLFGGTWESFGQGRTLIGVNTSDGDFNGVEKTGGSKTKTIATGNLPAHTHSIPALSGTAASSGAHTHTVSGTAASSGAHTHSVSGTAASSGAHTHEAYLYRNYNGGTTSSGANWTTSGLYRYVNVSTPITTSSNGAHTHTVSGTAASSGAHTHTVSGTAASSGAHTHSVSTNASTTGGTGNGEALSTLDPYITVYMWKRTA